MSADAASGSGLKLTRTQWLICFIATIGFLFDIYEPDAAVDCQIRAGYRGHSAGNT